MGFIGKQPTPVPLTSSDITDGIISTAKIADDAVGNTKLDLSANYAFTGTVTGASYVEEYDIFYQTLNLASDVSSTTDLTANLQRFDGGGFEKIGTGMSLSSGVFTFPSTGKYHILAKANMQSRNGATTQSTFRIAVTLNNSDYNERARAEGSSPHDSTFTLIASTLLDVTDTSNVKVKFQIQTSTNACRTLGASGIFRTGFTFIKLGST